jgi:hypothetical protein
MAGMVVGTMGAERLSVMSMKSILVSTASLAGVRVRRPSVTVTVCQPSTQGWAGVAAP